MRNITTQIVDNYPVLLDFQQISEITGIKVKTLRVWKNRGKLPFSAKKVGRTWRVHVNQVVEFIDNFDDEKSKRRPGRPRKEEQFQTVGG